MQPERVVRELGVAPVRDRRLHERLVGVGRGRLVLRAADDDARVGLAHDVQQHVRILILRPLRAVALRVGVGGHVEQVLAEHPIDVPADVLAEARVDLVQDVLAVVERPHLADGLVAHARHDAADLVHDGVDRRPLVPPVGLRARQLQADGKRLAVLLVGQPSRGAPPRGPCRRSARERRRSAGRPGASSRRRRARRSSTPLARHGATRGSHCLSGSCGLPGSIGTRLGDRVCTRRHETDGVAAGGIAIPRRTSVVCSLWR